jgi:hypothetical protein
MALTNILFIDDDYFGRKYPLPINMERKNMLSTIEMAQATKMRDFLGSCLYEHIEDAFLNQTLTADEQTLMGYLQYLMVFYAAQDMVDFIRIDNTLGGGLDRDQIMQSNSEKADVLERICSDFIIATDAIKAIGKADDCTDKFEEHDTTSSSGVYYPYNYTSGATDCDNDGFWKFYPAP